MQECKFCHNSFWKMIGTISSGIWDVTNLALQRKALEFPIGQCANCGHVQVTTLYTEEIFSTLYFSSGQSPDMWSESKVDMKSPYDEMVEFFSDLIEQNQKIVDFGCGEGFTLKVLKKNKNINLDLYGVDFSPHLNDKGITEITWDINKLGDLKKGGWGDGIDIALSSHVLEHVVSPIEFLDSIRKNLKDDGKLFIEVPDCSSSTPCKNLALTNLVHGQHIHYYTKDSLIFLAQKAGFGVLKVKQFMTGDIPRLQILFEKVERFSEPERIKDTAVKSVKSRFSQLNFLCEKFYNILIDASNNGEFVGLWGVGGDLYYLIKKFPDLTNLISENKIILFDQELAGHSYCGQTILSSGEISSCEGKVFMTPLYVPTRDRMIAVSKPWKANIIDPYFGS